MLGSFREKLFYVMPVLITIFFAAFCYVTPVTLLLFLFTKNAPGGDLIRVDLIRFPGSIPGDYRCAPTGIHLLYLV